MSTSLNTIAGTIYEDFIHPLIPLNTLSEFHASLIIKTTVVILGVVCVFNVFLVEKLGGVLQVK